MVRSRCLLVAVLMAFSALLAARPDGAEAEPSASDQAPAEMAAAEDGSTNSIAELRPLWPRTWEFAPDYTLRLRGRIDADAIWVEQSAENAVTFGMLEDVVGLRRARVGIEGELGTDRRYVGEIELSSGDVVPKDVYYAHGNRQQFGECQFGHFREPFSLEGGTSARVMPFMERSEINMLDPARHWGIALFRENQNQDAAMGVGVFYAGTGPAGLESGEGSTVDFTGRFTMCPIYEDQGRRLLHLGLVLSELVPQQGTIVINQQPQTSLLKLEDSTTSSFVPKIVFEANSQEIVNLQLSAARGSFWAQSEWYGTWIDQTSGAGTVFYRGCYASCGYFLTGEHRQYDTADGTLGAVRVNRPWLRGAASENRLYGYGAWELTARFAYLDYVDADTPLTKNGQIQGIRLPQMTYGVNWYLSDRVRMMLNYTYDMPDEVTTGSSTASTIATRMAVYW